MIKSYCGRATTIGEAEYARTHESNGFWFESELEAEAFFMLLIMNFREFLTATPHLEISKRETKNQYGTAWSKSDPPRITLYPRGMTAGTLIHEFAHLVSDEGHSHRFKAIQTALLRWFDLNKGKLF